MRLKISIATAAWQLGCSDSTVRRLVARGKLEGFKYGDNTSAIYVSQDSVDALIDAGRRGTAVADHDDDGPDAA